MMQNLLAERFGLKIHKENKELPVYHLVAGKNGPKLKKADENAMTQFQMPGGGGPGTSDRRVDGPGGPAAGAAAGGPGGPGGRGPGPGMMMMRMGQGGTMALQAKGMTLASFADMLARQVGKPVFDQTGIDGKYDIDLEFKPEPGGGMMRGLPTPMPHGDGGGPAPENAETGASIYTAIQDQLGLKLEAKKGAVETIVIDSANKTPTEN